MLILVVADSHRVAITFKKGERKVRTRGRGMRCARCAEFGRLRLASSQCYLAASVQSFYRTSHHRRDRHAFVAVKCVRC